MLLFSLHFVVELLAFWILHEMESGDLLPSSDAAGAAASTTKVFSSTDTGLFGKARYKFWVIAAILLLAFWSLLTGTVTLRWSAGDLSRVDHLDDPVRADLDILEIEESEKVVRHMWDAYAHNRRIRMPRFWQEAFEAAYEELAGDDLAARDAAITEIARMSVLMGDLEARRRNPKAAEASRKRRVGGNITSPKSSSLSSVEAR